MSVKSTLLVTGHTWVWGFTVIMPHRRKRRAEVFLFVLSHLKGTGLEPSKTERQGNQLAFLDSALHLSFVKPPSIRSLAGAIFWLYVFLKLASHPMWSNQGSPGVPESILTHKAHLGCILKYNLLVEHFR